MTKFTHDGFIEWSCSSCEEAGTFRFDGLETAGEDPTKDDYIIVLARAEAEHAVKCSGRLELEGGFRHRYVERPEGDRS